MTTSSDLRSSGTSTPGYPGTGYNNQGDGYNRGTGNPVTEVIDSLLGNRYSVTDRQCANAARAHAGQQYRGYGGGLRVSSISGVERRNNGLRVTGTLSAGGGYGGQYGGQYGYQNRGYGQGSARAMQAEMSASAATSPITAR